MNNKGPARNFLEEKLLILNLIENLSDLEIYHPGRRKVDMQGIESRRTNILR
jgi:hypothetical protein